MINFNNIYDTALSFLFTKRCRYCRKVCNIFADICEECAEDISEIEGDICFKCGQNKVICNCKGKFHYYESVCAPFYYEGAPKKAVISLKHKNHFRVIEGLSNDMVKCINSRYPHIYFDFCTFVPMHREDEKKRGYNQARLLAESIAKELEIPCLELIKKDYKTLSQHKLSETKRYGNLNGAFSFNPCYGVNVKDMRILLCDDIKTTGATLDECSKMLLFAGAAEVRCITACITKPLNAENNHTEKTR